MPTNWVNNMTLQPVILAGGPGTRLWPLSKESYSKPFLAINGVTSLIQETAIRLKGLSERPAIVVCAETNRFLVKDQLEEINQHPASIILEPTGKNTAPALTIAAIQAVTENKDAILLSLHSDHIIKNVDSFQNSLKSAVPVAAAGDIVTFGIVPSTPHSGFGYLRKGKLENGLGKLLDFIEKPDRETALNFLNSGEYLWNSGILMLKASLWLEQVKTHAPEIYKTCTDAMDLSTEDGLFIRPDSGIFRTCPSDAIDYAVMEKVVRDPKRPACWVSEINAGWSDLGSWNSFWEDGIPDNQGNVTSGDVFLQSVSDSLVLSTHRTVGVLGLKQAVVVETADSILVTTMEHEESVKNLVTEINSKGKFNTDHHVKIHRPWGSYEILDEGAGFQVKRLTVRAGESLSLQVHKHRAEHWVVVKGTASVTKGENTLTLEENESTFISQGETHRLENKTDSNLEIIEVQSGSYLGEDDIVRIEDKYNRTDGPA